MAEVGKLLNWVKSVTPEEAKFLTDSRWIRPGDVLLSVSDASRDSVKEIAEALGKGASLVLSSLNTDALPNDIPIRFVRGLQESEGLLLGLLRESFWARNVLKMNAILKDTDFPIETLAEKVRAPYPLMLKSA